MISIPQQSQFPKQQHQELRLPLETEEVSAAARSLLNGDTIEDATDRKIIEGALIFIKTPTGDLEVMKNHLTGIAMVLIPYGEIENQPPALSAINRKLFTLISERRIELIGIELRRDVHDKKTIQQLIEDALNSSGVLAKYYGDNVLFNRVKELQEEVGV